MKLSSLKKKYQRINEIQKEAAIQELTRCGFDEMYLRKNEDFLIKLMCAEGEVALRSNNNALGWYDSTLKLAKDLLSKDVGNTPALFPELNKDNPDTYDEGLDAAFNFALAVTSNGQVVTKNFKDTVEIYKDFKNTGSN